MEQHPIPRNISGFQFRLVGDMTLKQFGYLAAGIILAYVSFKMPLPQFLGLPLGFIFFVTGLGFAFVPIQERPLDRWFIAFLKSVYSPTQFIWQKNNPPPEILTNMYAYLTIKTTPVHVMHHQDARQKLNNYLLTLKPTVGQVLDQTETARMQKMLSLFNSPSAPALSSANPVPQVQPVPVPPPPPKPEEDALKQAQVSLRFKTGQEPKNADFVPKPTGPKTLPTKTPSSQPEELINQEAEKLRQAQEGLKKELETKSIEKDKFLELERKLTEMMTEKERLTQELISLKRQNVQSAAPKTVKPTMTEVTSPSRVKSVAPKQAAETLGLPTVPNIPNIILGVVKDSLDRFLPGIIISVKDKNNFPLRALRTNKLGQFAAATPLPNGIYLIEIEDPQKRYQFDIVEISLTGAIFPPLEIIAKGEKEMMRERLAKEIFGDTGK